MISAVKHFLKRRGLHQLFTHEINGVVKYVLLVLADLATM